MRPLYTWKCTYFDDSITQRWEDSRLFPCPEDPPIKFFIFSLLSCEPSVIRTRMISRHRQKVVAFIVEGQAPLADNFGAHIRFSIIPGSILDHITLRRGFGNQVNLVIMITK